jgi:L-amino acid N-acyltransferase YncA
MIRPATVADAEAILAIYAPYIRDTSITFETEVPSAEDFAKRIEHYMENFPWLVYEVDGVIAGYAYASRYRDRIAYQWSVECSVYVHNTYFRKGIARKLYAALFRFLQKQEFRLVYAVINLPNDESVALHESMGFSWFATYEQVGYKLGRWKNVGWWKLQLNDFIDEPPAPLPFPQLDKTVVSALLQEK